MLGKAEWPLLKKANFSWRLGKGTSWELLFAFSLFLFLLRASSPLVSVFRGPGVSRRMAMEQKGCWAPCAAAGSSRTLGGGEPGGLRMLHGVFHGASQASLQGFRAPATSGHRLFLLRQDPRGTRRASLRNTSSDCGGVTCGALDQDRHPPLLLRFG